MNSFLVIVIKVKGTVADGRDVSACIPGINVLAHDKADTCNSAPVVVRTSVALCTAVYICTCLHTLCMLELCVQCVCVCVCVVFCLKTDKTCPIFPKTYDILQHFI